MTINQKKSLVAFYISKFNDDAFRELSVRFLNWQQME